VRRRPVSVPFEIRLFFLGDNDPFADWTCCLPRALLVTERKLSRKLSDRYRSTQECRPLLCEYLGLLHLLDMRAAQQNVGIFKWILPFMGISVCFLLFHHMGKSPFDIISCLPFLSIDACAYVTDKNIQQTDVRMVEEIFVENRNLNVPRRLMRRLSQRRGLYMQQSCDAFLEMSTFISSDERLIQRFSFKRKRSVLMYMKLTEVEQNIIADQN
jgi:hypothetical protein